jgi:uncharacterized glyoxalase superfamily protein PhnB
MAKRKVAKKAPKKTSNTRARQAASRTAAPKRTTAGLSLGSIAPFLTVNDIQKSVQWYMDVLGFTMGDKWEHEGKLMGGELSAGKSTFWLMQDDWKKGRDRVKGQGVRIFCTTTDDIDGLAKRITSKGGTLAQEPRNEFDMRSLSLDDPDGYKLTIAKNLK